MTRSDWIFLQKPSGKLLGCKVVRSMFVVLLTLALWPCDAVKDEKVGMVDALCNAVKVPMLCNDKQQLIDACQTNPQSCCKESTCAAMPGMGCWKRRGDTQCEGDSVFPPKIGSCQCLSGYCNSDGKCSVTMGFHGQASSGYTAFGRLYEDSDEPIPPEDHSVAMACYALAFLSMVSLGLFLVMRSRRQVPGPEYASREFLVDEVEDQIE